MTTLPPPSLSAQPFRPPFPTLRPTLPEGTEDADLAESAAEFQRVWTNRVACLTPGAFFAAHLPRGGAGWGSRSPAKWPAVCLPPSPAPPWCAKAKPRPRSSCAWRKALSDAGARRPLRRGLNTFGGQASAGYSAGTGGDMRSNGISEQEACLTGAPGMCLLFSL